MRVHTSGFVKVAVGSRNKAKADAVKNVFGSVFGDVEVVPVASDSNVRPQPMSDDEAIDGAINRARQALEKVDGAEYGVGLEGAVEENKHGMFLGGWVAIINRNEIIGMGGSGKMELPESVAEKLRKGEELRPVIRNLSEAWHLSSEELDNLETFGTLGILTKGLYPRVDEFEDAVKCALSRFLSKDKYED